MGMPQIINKHKQSDAADGVFILEEQLRDPPTR